MTRLDRLLRPRSIAVVGGGTWCANVVRACAGVGFAGPVWPVHPRRDSIAGVPAHAGPEALPGVPDAVFIGVNRAATIESLRACAALGAGGAVCFASGFAEAETGDGAALQAALLEAADGMPVLGPNCYGFLNLLDGAALWPDQHGAQRVQTGVALVTQSSNIALNLTHQTRGLPLAYVVTVGNQAQIGLAEVGQGLLEDPRVTALGLHIEGVGDLRAFEAMAARAHDLGKPIVALKMGRSAQARAATQSHTAALAGSDAGGRALLRRLGIAQVASLSDLLETLMLLHAAGPLPGNRIAALSCSGGEASLVADQAEGLDLVFPALGPDQAGALRAALGPRVALANPLDYHTYIWGDPERLAACFAAMMRGALDMGLVILDFPRADRCDGSEWHLVIAAAEAAQGASGKPMAIVSSIPETLPEEVSRAVCARGLVPLHGLSEALVALDRAAWLGRYRDRPAPVLIPGAPRAPVLIDEAEAKARLAEHGLPVPRGARADTPQAAARVAEDLGVPVAVKRLGLAHKTGQGAVTLGVQGAAAVAAAAASMPGPVLVEEMVPDAVAELLVGVVRDPAHGFVLTLGAGGTQAELRSDRLSMLLPVTQAEVRDGLAGLRMAPVLRGYRGAPGVDAGAIALAVMAVQAFVIAQAGRLEEVEINPLICNAGGVCAADALLRMGGEND